MPILVNTINPKDESFITNRQWMEKLCAGLRERVAAIALGGGERARAKHPGRRKPLPRERVRRALDTAITSWELSQPAAYQVYENEIPAAGLITGISRVPGQERLIIANNHTAEGAHYYPLTVK